MNTLEPNSNVRDESNAGVELGADLALVDVVSQAVRDNVVGQELNVVLRARLGTSAGVSRNPKSGGLATEEGNQGSDSDLSGSSIASRVGNTGCLSNLGAVDQLGKTVGPVAVETVVGAQVDNDIALLRALVDSINERRTDAVRQSHNPAVYITVLRHAFHILGAQVLVDDLTLVVALKLLAGELTGRDMAQVQVRVSVDQANECLTGVATGTNQSNLGGTSVGVVLLTKGRVRVGGGVRTDAVQSRAEGRPGSPQDISSGREGTGLLERGGAGADTLT